MSNPAEEPNVEEDVFIDPEDAVEETPEEEDAPMDEDEDEEQDGQIRETDFRDDSIQAFYPHRQPIYAIDLHPVDSTLVVTGGGDDLGYLWRTTNATDESGDGQVAVLSGHTDSITSSQFSKDGQYVATGGLDGKVRVWKLLNIGGKVNGAQFLHSLEGPDEVVWIQWHPKGAVLLAGATDGTVWMWQIPSGTVMNVFAGHSGPVACGSFTPNGKNIVTGSEDGSIIIWDPKTAASVHRIDGTSDARFDLGGGVHSLAINADSTLAVCGGANGQAILVNLANGTPLAQLAHADAKAAAGAPAPVEPEQKADEDAEMEELNSIEAVAFCDILSFVVTTSVEGKICIWDTSSMKLRSSAQQEDAITSITFVPGTPFFLTTSNDRSVRRYDVRTGKENRVWHGHQEAVLVCSVSKDGNVIVSAGDDGVALVWPPT